MEIILGPVKMSSCENKDFDGFEEILGSTKKYYVTHFISFHL